MNEWWRSIHVNVVNDEIIVSLPGTSYGVTYFKRETISPASRKKHLAF